MAPKAKKMPANPSPLERMQEVFAKADVDMNGDVTKEEFLTVMDNIGVSKSDAEGIFKRFDTNRNDILDKDEFFAFVSKGAGELNRFISRYLIDTDQEIITVFNKWDTDGSGRISKDEFINVFVTLNPAFTKKELEASWKAIDKNGDGELDTEEFIAWVKDGILKEETKRSGGAARQGSPAQPSR
eukprot:TRINITY_DN73455_c0_g1_i1.p1 TRINITY_DN73455_c0_g1~~TRINITY_DN73455_c0_g1_i1.p1  ORF type:complete len:185 (-),score=34.88 TRINITY_DN73455_c0_g1_i1:723-1277(-)